MVTKKGNNKGIWAIAIILYILAGCYVGYGIYQHYPYATPFILFVFFIILSGKMYSKPFIFVLLSLIVFQSLILIYVPLFAPIYTEDVTFYVYIISFMLFLIIFAYQWNRQKLIN